ncbi:MAG: hypothetical protein Q8S03_10345 [Brevundimonas sp.]|uniref:hypothetical protein n=1 Tax=Brevundimonas sp. TaxID=1871086 RepID=UPI0027359194|nr:hypothetical protein [Brevundimonas sp.]MDP3405079.1 hypothetical protein [Brevundimonas sp.]
MTDAAPQPRDPMEAIVAAALDRAGIGYVRIPKETAGLDFRLTGTTVHIEVKRFHSPRIAEQMSRTEDVIAIQGEPAVKWFADRIGNPRLPVVQEPERAWAWWASRDEENYTVGPCATRDEVIQTARTDFDGEGFHVIEALTTPVTCLIPSGRQFIEHALEDAADNGLFGEDGDFGVRGPAPRQAEAIGALDAVLGAWTHAYGDILPRPWAFAQTRNPAWFDGENAEAEA